jgi:nucleoside-diphosphate-sugar epimerase
MKNALAPTGAFIWVDVRDVAMAHAKAMELPEAAGKRFFVTAGYMMNKDIVDCVRRAFPELSSELPPEDAESDLPKDAFRYDNSRSVGILGLEYRSLEDCCNRHGQVPAGSWCINIYYSCVVCSF